MHFNNSLLVHDLVSKSSSFSLTGRHGFPFSCLSNSLTGLYAVSEGRLRLWGLICVIKLKVLSWLNFGSLIELSFDLLSFIIYILSIYAIDLLPWSERIRMYWKKPSFITLADHPDIYRIGRVNIHCYTLWSVRTDSNTWQTSRTVYYTMLTM